GVHAVAPARRPGRGLHEGPAGQLGGRRRPALADAARQSGTAGPGRKAPGRGPRRRPLDPAGQPRRRPRAARPGRLGPVPERDAQPERRSAPQLGASGAPATVGAFIGRRLLQSGLTVLAVSALVFTFMTVAGDPAILLLPPEAGTAELERFRHELGLDR